MSRQQRRRAARTREDVGGVTLWHALRAVFSRAAGLGAHERLVLLCVWRHTNFDRETFLASATIAAETGLTRWTVLRVVERLRTAGALQIDRGGGRSRANLYHASREWVAARLPAVKCASDGEIARNGDGNAPFEPDENGTAPADGNGLKGDRRAPFNDEKGDAVAPFSGKGADDAGNCAPSTINCAPSTVNCAPASHVVPSVVPSVEPSVEGGRRRARDTPHASSPTEIPERIANTIAAATARLGGDLAREGRNIADRFLSERSATTAWSCLGSLAKRAGVKREALGVSFEAIHAAGYAPSGPEESP
jgi:hypothetical protein